MLRAGDESPEALPRLPAPASPAALAYPEWDYRAGVPTGGRRVIHRQTGQQGPLEWVVPYGWRSTHGSARRVRTRFEGLRPRRTRLDRQPDGSRNRPCRLRDGAADLRAGRNGDDRLYVASRPARRELAVALLADVSASTDGWVGRPARIVDVEKEALLVVCEALDALGDRHAVFAFSGEGPEPSPC